MFIYASFIAFLTGYAVYFFYKESIYQFIVLKLFQQFKHGNFELINLNTNQVIFSKINNKELPIAKAYAQNVGAFFTAIYKEGELGLGESYVRGEWSSNDITYFLTTIVSNRNNECISKLNQYTFSNTISSDKKNVMHHYDVGNDFYETFLTDSFSAYTCGFFLNDTTTLEDAQKNKVDTIIRKLNPAENKTILDIGCGWGKIANYVSKKTKCKVTGVSISKEQIKYINANLPDICVIEKDYRDINETFDYIYVIGMIEHVRYKNYDDFFNTIKRCLNVDGRCVLHTIVTLEKTNEHTVNETFISKHIFPGGQIPNNDWITNAVMRAGLNIIHSEFFGGQHYARTLRHWRENMMKNKEYIIKQYGIQLLNTYEYYLASCEAMFNTGSMGISHYVITNKNEVDLQNNFVYFK